MAAALFVLFFSLQGHVALPGHVALHTQQCPPQHALPPLARRGWHQQLLSNQICLKISKRAESRLRAVLKILFNHLGTSDKGVEPLLMHQTHPSSEVCLRQPAEPTPDDPGFILNVPREHHTSLPHRLTPFAFFTEHGRPLNGSFNPIAAGFLKRKWHSLTKENRVWATMSNFFHENHTSSHHQEAQNGIKALSSQSKENKREKTLSACHSNSAFHCTLLGIISFLIEQLVPDKSLIFSSPSILQLLFANTRA